VREDAPSALDNPADPAFPDPLIDLYHLLSGGPPPDGIPAIDDPKFQAASEVDWLDDSEPLLSLTVGGETRGYPLQIMTWHEIVNDTVDGVPVAVTYCPRCNSGVDGSGFCPAPGRRWCRDPTQIVWLGLALVGYLGLGADLTQPELPERGLDLLAELVGQVTTGILQRQRAEIDEQPRVPPTEFDLCRTEQRREQIRDDLSGGCRPQPLQELSGFVLGPACPILLRTVVPSGLGAHVHTHLLDTATAAALHPSHHGDPSAPRVAGGLPFSRIIPVVPLRLMAVDREHQGV